MKSSNKLVMKIGESWVFNSSEILKIYFLQKDGAKKPIATSNPEEAEEFNWFWFGFIEEIFMFYNIHVKPAYILKMKKGKF